MTTPEARQPPPPPAVSVRWTVLRFVTQELRRLASLVRWAARRRHGVDGADAFFSHGRDQAIMMYGLTFACVVETVALSYLLADWPVIHTVLLVVDVYTVLFAGAGVQPGIVYGKSDKLGAYPTEHPTSPADFVATIYHLLGIDPHREEHDQLGRPFQLAKGDAIAGIMV